MFRAHDFSWISLLTAATYKVKFSIYVSSLWSVRKLFLVPDGEKGNSKFTCVNKSRKFYFNPLNAELNPICYLLALLPHHFLHVSRIRVKSLTLRLLMSYMECLFLMFLDHTQRRTTVGGTPLDE